MPKLLWIEKKIISAQELAYQCAAWHNTSQRIVFTNGCFDVLHLGHFRLLAQAAEEGTKLVVALNTDASVKRLKGPTRPLNNEADRAFAIASLLYVDAVCLFDEDTPAEIIKLAQPDVLVKGGDYTPDTIVGADTVLARGGRIAVIPFVTGYSTTGMMEKMKC